MKILFSEGHAVPALWHAIQKLHPITQFKNPVMFVVYVGAIITTACSIYEYYTGQPLSSQPLWFAPWISAWLWITVLFANFAESIAEGKGRAQAASLRTLRKEVNAKKIRTVAHRDDYNIVSAASLRKDDLVLIEAGDTIPGDGQVVDGIASVDESAITGESAPVIRESGGEQDALTGGTRVLSDWVVMKVTANAGETHIDRMVNLVEGAKRQKTPNEVALGILLGALTQVFILSVLTLLPFSMYSAQYAGGGQPIGVVMLTAILVCLVPTSISGLLSAIGIAGMNRLLKANVTAISGWAVEAAGDVNILLLDKTGTITHGNRQAEALFAAEGVTDEALARAAQLSSFADQTPEGKSILALARRKYPIICDKKAPEDARFIEFAAETRLSGIIIGNREILKGASDAIEQHLQKTGGKIPDSLKRKVDDIGRHGGTPLVVIDNNKAVGVVYLKDVVKSGIKERLSDLRRMGIKSIMITGDNPLTAAAIAAEAGVDDYLPQSTPEAKLKLIRKLQAAGEMVAMVGDGTNDAPALAQSDVAVVMNSGTQAAKEAGNMIDLDSNPTKLIEIIQIGKQLLMTRGALTTFSVANDMAKYFAVIPSIFAATYPHLGMLNFMGLTSPTSAMLSAVMFNALTLIFLVPLALKGVHYRPVAANTLLRRHLLIYGLGGIIAPFIGIKMIDMVLTLMGWV